MDLQTVPLRVLLLLPTILLFGCEDIVRTDLVHNGNVKVQAGDSSVVDLSPPQVFRDGDKIEIIGAVTRKPANDAPIPNGYVLIQLLDSTGNEIDEIWSTWVPADIPTDGNRQSTYDITYLWNPPPGTVIRVVYGPTEEALESSTGGTGKGVASAKGTPGHAPPASSHGHYGGGSGSFSNGLGFQR